jgi:hypothetical protein
LVEQPIRKPFSPAHVVEGYESVRVVLVHKNTLLAENVWQFVWQFDLPFLDHLFTFRIQVP